MKKFLLIIMMLSSFMSIYARCGYCYGNGRVKTHIGISGFGISTEKYKCKYCGKWVPVSDDHWDTCPQCHGDPDGVGHHPRHDDDDYSPSNDLYLRYLTPAEYADWKNCITLAMEGGTKLVDCHICNGDGKCRLCNGTGLSPFQNPDDLQYLGMLTPCPTCFQSGKCQTCFGYGQVSVPDESIKEVAKQRLEYYRDLVYKRMEEDSKNK